MRWMEEYFPDVIPLIGERELAGMWVHNPRGALITVKVGDLLPPSPISSAFSFL